MGSVSEFSSISKQTANSILLSREFEFQIIDSYFKNILNELSIRVLEPLKLQLCPVYLYFANFKTTLSV